MTNILIVDDYAPNHRLMSFVLEQSGFAVVSALDGLNALDCLERMQIDLIVTDLTMPRLDGLGLAARVRSDARFSAIPIIVVTASGVETDEARAEGVGVDAFLTKPVDSEELARAVCELIAKDAPPGGATALRKRRSAA
ncbi:MAG TPA: response regulator [Chloroflexaceae bacterium]|nr:response regulator [Chloroflexaceae bacterium]